MSSLWELIRQRGSRASHAVQTGVGLQALCNQYARVPVFGNARGSKPAAAIASDPPVGAPLYPNPTLTAFPPFDRVETSIPFIITTRTHPLLGLSGCVYMTNDHYGCSRNIVKMASLDVHWICIVPIRRSTATSKVCTAASQGCDARRRGSSGSRGSSINSGWLFAPRNSGRSLLDVVPLRQEALRTGDFQRRMGWVGDPQSPVSAEPMRWRKWQIDFRVQPKPYLAPCAT